MNGRGKLGEFFFFSSCKPFQLCSGFRTDAEKSVYEKESLQKKKTEKKSKELAWSLAELLCLEY